MKTDILGHNFEELEDAFIGIGEKRFRGKQIAYWLYKRNVVDFEEMANLSKALREKLAEHFTIGKLKPLKTEDDETGTSKTLWELADGETIESVLIPDENRLTLCVSTQVGCPLGCKFCATGNIGYKRNLTAGEIMNQFLQSREKAGERISNIVFMGMGEPLLNLDNLSKVLEILINDYMVAFGAKKITVSTSGIPSKIRELADTGKKICLAFSLNAPNDELRNSLMPVNHKYNLAENIEALKYFQSVNKRRITFEYVLIGGVNDSIEHAKQFVSLIHGIPCKINLIRYNPIEANNLKAPDEKAVNEFREYLYPRTPAVTLRESKGSKIAAACGQLRGKYATGKE